MASYEELQLLATDAEASALPGEGAGRSVPWRWALPFSLAAAGTVGLSVGAWQQAAPRGGQPPGVPPPIVDLEGSPALDYYSMPVAIRWTAEENQCIRVDPSKAVSLGECGEAAFQFAVPEGLQGPIRLATDAQFCLTRDSDDSPAKLVTKQCGLAPLEWVVGDKRIRMKSDELQCLHVNRYEQDALMVDDCQLWEGDLIQAPQPRDYDLELEWPKAATTNTTTTATMTSVTSTTVEDLSPKLPYRTMLKSVHGNYIVAELGGAMFANRPWADDWEKFEVLYKAPDTIALRSYHGYYVTASAVGGTMEAIAPTAEGDDTSFTVTFAPDGAVMLKSFFGFYVCAEPWGVLLANRHDPNDWEEFVVMDVADEWPMHVGIKTVHQKYLRGYPTGDVIANGKWPLDDWERFHVQHHGEGTISLQCDHGEYISVNLEGGNLLSRKGISDTEMFTVTHLPDGNFTLQDHTGRYITASPNGTVKAQNTDLFNAWEKLEVVFLK